MSGFFVPSSVDIPFGQFNNCAPQWANAHTVKVGQSGERGSCRDSTDVHNIEWVGVIQASLALPVGNPSALDVGVEQADEWYHFFVIADTTGENSPAGLWSASDTAPTLPDGYDIFRRLGEFKNDSSSDIWEFEAEINHEGLLIVYYIADSSSARVLAAGNATNGSGTDVDCSDYASPNSKKVDLIQQFKNQSGGAADLVWVNKDGYNGMNTVVKPGAILPSFIKKTVHNVPCDPDTQVIHYAVTNANDIAYIDVTRYYANLNVV